MYSGQSIYPYMHSPNNSSLKVTVEMMSFPLYNGVIPPNLSAFNSLIEAYTDRGTLDWYSGNADSASDVRRGERGVRRVSTKYAGPGERQLFPRRGPASAW